MLPTRILCQTCQLLQGLPDSLQAVSPIVTVLVCYFSLQRLCICSGERCKRRGAC